MGIYPTSNVFSSTRAVFRKTHAGPQGRSRSTTLTEHVHKVVRGLEERGCAHTVIGDLNLCEGLSKKVCRIEKRRVSGDVSDLKRVCVMCV
jgi:hypothetical protein